MAQRTTIAKVQALLEAGRDYDSNKRPNLQPFIDSAYVIVDRVATCATDRSYTLNSTELELIERWLAAWFYKGPDPQYASKSTGGASASVMGQKGMYLEGNEYGQRALAIDTSGCLAAIASGAERKVAKGVWLGKAPSDQTDYVDRD